VCLTERWLFGSVWLKQLHREESFSWSGPAGQSSGASYLVFGVENHGLRVRHSDHVVVEGGGGQPHSARQLVVEQRQLRDQALGLLLLGVQRGQTLPDAHQRLDELPLRSQTHRLQTKRQTRSEGQAARGRGLRDTQSACRVRKND